MQSRYLDLMNIIFNPNIPPKEKDAQVFPALKQLIADSDAAASIFVIGTLFSAVRNMYRTISGTGIKIDMVGETGVFFYALKEQQIRMRNEFLQQLSSFKADDGKFYTHDHTECDLFRNARFKINEDGTMTIDFSDSESFRQHYLTTAQAATRREDADSMRVKLAANSPGGDPDIFRYDLRVLSLCSRAQQDVYKREIHCMFTQLGLTIVTLNEDHVIIDHASSMRLQEKGFHYDPEYVESLLNAEQRALQEEQAAIALANKEEMDDQFRKAM